MTNLTLWASPSWGTTVRQPSPFAELDSRLRNALRSNTLRSAGPDAGFRPAAEVTRDGEDAVVKVELPGVDIEKDIKVEMNDGRLVIHGERRDEHSRDEHRGDGHRILREMRYGSFRRIFTLPTHVTSEAISASYDAGVLTVRVAGAYAGTAPTPIPITK